MSSKRGYSLEKHDDHLVFTTSSFRAEKSSVLHSGIFNYEFRSLLSASAVSGIVFVLVAVRYRVTFVLILITVAVFITVFILLRRFVFRERSLKVDFDSSKGVSGGALF